MKKMIIFPINNSYSKLVNIELDILRKYDIVGIMLPGEKKIEREINKNIRISYDFEGELKDTDIVYILDTIQYIDLDRIIIPRISQAVRMGIKVYVTREVINKLKKKNLKDIAEKLCPYDCNEVVLDFMEEYCFKINTPIVGIAGIGDSYDQFYIELNYRKQLLNRGIKIFQIGSRKESKIFGLETLPNFINDNRISAQDKAIFFNHYLKHIEIEYNPDLILIGIPGNIISLEESIKSDYGMAAMILTSTINIDYSIIQIPYGLYPINEIERLSQVLGIKYGLHGDFYIISNKLIALAESREQHDIRYIELCEELEEINRKDESVKIKYIYENFAEELVMDSIDKLKSYNEIKLV